MSESPEMIFHAPYAIREDAVSASGIRPQRMLQAFEAIGFRVHAVTGTSTERARRITELRRLIERGAIKPSFVYSEASTMPCFMTDPDHLPRHPWLDASFFKFCEAHGIRVGLFYRDVYWRFPIYRESVKWPLSTAMIQLYRWELRQYRRANIDVYLPSLEMGKWLPGLAPQKLRELPPGGTVREHGPDQTDSPVGTLRILYVGGLGSNYRLHDSVREIAGTPGVELTICTREAEWRQREPEYREYMAPNIRVVHRSGEELDSLYASADVCLLAVEPIDYWEFAVPMKLIEYVCNGKPVIASERTYSARFVREQGVGWVIEYGSNGLGALLDRLRQDMTTEGEVARLAEHVREVRGAHTWEARAKQVAADLSPRASD